MFDNIGAKIQKVAKGLMYFWIIASIAVGIFMFIEGLGEDELLLVVLGPAVIAIGCVMAPVSVYLLYGFGKLIEDVEAIRRNSTPGIEASMKSERMNKLKRLRSQGLITKEEYQQAIAEKQ